jgi:creatinine amidohydrolase
MENKPLYRHTEMKWPEFAEFVKKTDFAVLPVGAIEQHGPHLPFKTDVIIAEYLAECIARETGALLMDSLKYAPDFSLRYYPGTVRLSDQLFTKMVIEITESIFSHGVKTVYVMVGHHGAFAACKEAERELLLTSKARIVNLNLPGLNEAISKYCISKRWNANNVHAEEFETSCILALRPDLVDMKKAVKEYPPIDPLFGAISIPWIDFCKSGVIGDATVATPEKGKAILDFMVAESLKLINYHQSELKKGRIYK